MGVRTIFNILGPLTNPAGAQRQLMGVFTPDLTEFLANVLRELGTTCALVVCGYGNMDELTTTGPNRVSHCADGVVRTYELNPLDYHLKTAHISELMGGDADTNATILRGILSGEIDSAKHDVVLLNAGAALIAAGKVTTFEDGIALARQVIDSGAGLARLDALVRFSQELANGG
jgi:anthranilate phosphoribosyltransferase